LKQHQVGGDCLQCSELSSLKLRFSVWMTMNERILYLITPNPVMFIAIFNLKHHKLYCSIKTLLYSGCGFNIQ